MVFLLIRIIGLGVETAEQLVREILSRNLRNRKAVARYAGLTGSPDESGASACLPFWRILPSQNAGKIEVWVAFCPKT